MIETNDKLLYEAPAAEVVELKTEGRILVGSGEGTNWGGGY